MSDEPEIFPQSPGPLPERVSRAVLLLLLLVVSGVTATVVGYRAKSAEFDRTRTLREHYEKLGGNRDTLYTVGASLSTALSAPHGADEKARTFVVVYELNERVRLIGLRPTVEGMSPEQQQAAMQGLRTVGMVAAAEAVEGGAHSATGSRGGSTYNRRMIREVDVALVRYLDGVKESTPLS